MNWSKQPKHWFGRAWLASSLLLAAPAICFANTTPEHHPDGSNITAIDDVPLHIQIGRAIRDREMVKIEGRIEDDTPDAAVLTIAGQSIETIGGRFKAELPATRDIDRIVVEAQNSNGESDHLSVVFDQQAPEAGLTVDVLPKLNNLVYNGFLRPQIEGQLAQEIPPAFKSQMDDALPTHWDIGFWWGGRFSGGFTNQVTTDGLIDGALSSVPQDYPGAIENAANLNIAGTLQTPVSLRSYARLQYCQQFWYWWWGWHHYDICGGFDTPTIALDLNDMGFSGLLSVAGEPNSDTIVDIQTQATAQAGNFTVQWGLFSWLGWVLDPMVNGLLDLIGIHGSIEGQLADNIKNGFDGQIAALNLSALPTRLPATLSELTDLRPLITQITGFEELGVLYKMVVRGIGLTDRVRGAMSAENRTIANIEANVYNESSDHAVMFGYVSRGSSAPIDNAIQQTPTADVADIYDVLVKLDTEFLNKTFKVLTQASVIDFTLPMSSLDSLSEYADLDPAAGPVTVRLYSQRSSSPYHSAPRDARDIFAIEFTDYTLELTQDNEVLFQSQLDLTAFASLYNPGMALKIDIRDADVFVHGASSQGETIPIDDTLNQYVHKLSIATLSTIFATLDNLEIPMLLGHTLAIDFWRPDPDRGDVIIGFKIDSGLNGLQNPEHLAGIIPHSPTGTDLAAENGENENPIESAGTLGDMLSGFLNFLKGFGAIATHIEERPANLAPDQGYATRDANTDKPMVPAINRQIVGLKNGEFTRSHMPDVRVTRDGRLGVGIFGGAFSLMKPESINEPFIPSKNKLAMTDHQMNFMDAINSSDFTADSIMAEYGAGNFAICDPDPGYAPAGKAVNPYVCGTSSSDECYDIHVIGETRTKLHSIYGDLIAQADQGEFKIEEAHLVSIPMRVRIENAKTPDATIVDIEITGEASISRPYSAAVFEMNSIFDGKLLITRQSLRALTWYHAPKDEYITGTYDAVYTVLPEACDVTEFDGFKPISHAPFDPQTKDTYKFAAYPFRDPTGAYIADGAEMKGTYPWLSRDGSMMALSMVGDARLFPMSDIDPSNTLTRYPSRCLDDQPECSVNTRMDLQFHAPDQGIAFFGLWTQGKVVLADGFINETDFKLDRGDKSHSLLALYEPYSGRSGDESGDVEIGETRARKLTGLAANNGSYLGNGTTFESATNTLNFWPTVRPATPRDVVWTFNTGRHSDEVAFDDYLNPNSFIVSHMVVASEHDNQSAVVMTYFDGWNQKELAYTNPVRVENSATALPTVWQIPKYGEVQYGRTEPTSTGGIHGKGMWLNGIDAHIQYNIVAQPQAVEETPWMFSLFIDPRFGNDDTERSLLHFPAGSSISVKGLRQLVYRNNSGAIVHQVSLPQGLSATDWNHLGWQTLDQGKQVSFYLNGFLLDTATLTDSAFLPTEGTLRVGGQANTTGELEAFHGWVDDFKMFAEVTHPEVMCNHALGTMIGLPDAYQGEWITVADDYPSTSHNFISRILKGYGKSAYEQYACYRNYSDDYAAHLQNTPQDTVALRDALTFPEGPLFHDAARPDSVNNTFCLSCHHPDGKGGLSLAALERNLGLFSKNDPRRQPMQPPALVSGQLPENWLAHSMGYASATAEKGQPFDELLMPSADTVSPEVKGLTLVDAKTGLDIMPIEAGTVLNLNALPVDLALRFAADGITETVQYSLGNQGGSLNSPFAPFGMSYDDNGYRQFNVADLQAGEYVVMAQASNSSADAFEVTFQVTGTPATASGNGFFELLQQWFSGIVWFFKELLT